MINRRNILLKDLIKKPQSSNNNSNSMVSRRREEDREVEVIIDKVKEVGEEDVDIEMITREKRRIRTIITHQVIP